MKVKQGIRVRFWGVRGSVPAPLTGKMVEGKIANAILRFSHECSAERYNLSGINEWMRTSLPFHERSTFGGNTTCVEVRCGSKLIILDMGTGLRELGSALIPEVIDQKGLQGVILQSHVHWDHIQGLPFFPLLYMPRSVFDNRFLFFGGKEWESSLEEVLSGQMDHPVFPVKMAEIQKTGLQMEFGAVHNGWSVELDGDDGLIKIFCRVIHHPQETFGYRIEYNGQVIAFCTDHEPFGTGIHKPLRDLAEGADLFITDCQYSLHEYTGQAGGVQKMGWGHSYPEYIADVAMAAKPKMVVTTHHDPAASDQRIVELATTVQTTSGIKTIPAYEGLELSCSELG